MSNYDIPLDLTEDLTLHSASLKRATDNDQVLYVPLAKRQQLDPNDLLLGTDAIWHVGGNDEQPVLPQCFYSSNIFGTFDHSMESQSKCSLPGDANIAASLMYIVNPADTARLPYPSDDTKCVETMGETLPPIANGAIDLAIKANHFEPFMHSDVQSDNASLSETLPLDTVWNDEDDQLLNELPTSVDDFQNKEYHLKLERHYSSPMVSSRQSPQYERTISGRGSIASEVACYPTACKLSITSNSLFPDDGPLDEEDLEVAMINESFEEQQKQTMLYECMGLKSIFYGANQNEPNVNEVFTESPQGTPSPQNVQHLNGGYDQNTSGATDKSPYFQEDVEFTPFLTPQSKTFVKQSVPVDPDDGSIVPSPHATCLAREVAYSDTSDDVDYDRQLHMELEKMILGDDEEVRQIEDAEKAACSGSTLLKVRTLSGALSDRSLPSLASLGNRPSRNSTDSEEFCPMENAKEGHSAEPKAVADDTIDIEERMLLSESVLRSLEEDDDYAELQDDKPILDIKSNTVQSSNNDAVLPGESTALTHEQEVPDGVADSWEDIEDTELEKAAREAFEAKASKIEIKTSASHAPADLPETELTHVLEAYFHSSKTLDILAETLRNHGFDDIYTKKVDERHALIIFPSTEKATNALFYKGIGSFKLRPLSEATQASKRYATEKKTSLKPNCARPATNVSVARRMIENTLGVRAKIPLEQRQKEKEQLKVAKQIKREKNAVWAE